MLAFARLRHERRDAERRLQPPRRAIGVLLRYFFAYSREYCMMYRDVLKDMRPRGELSVCSLGCGAEVDRWSLLRALALDSR